MLQNPKEPKLKKEGNVQKNPEIVLQYVCGYKYLVPAKTQKQI